MTCIKIAFSFLLLIGIISSCKSQQSNKTTIPPKECIELNNKGVACLMAFPDNGGKKLDSAIIFFNEAVKCDTTYLIAYQNLAGAYDRKKNYTNEKINLDKALMLTNNDPFYILRKGIVYEKMNKIDSANKTYIIAKVEYKKRINDKPNAILIDGLVLAKALTDGKEAAIKELNDQLKRYPELSSKLSYEYGLYRDFDRNAFIHDGSMSHSSSSN